MNITEDYCSYEVAKLLKEKGFDWKCLAHWYIDTNKNFAYSNYPQNWNDNTRVSELEWLSCPTLQMACRWLRETHKLFIEVHIEQGKKVSYKFIIWDFYIIHPNKYVGGTYDFREEQEGFSTPEQAVEAALKYSLENLI